MRDRVKQSTFVSYKGYYTRHYWVLGKTTLKKLEPALLQDFFNYKYRRKNSLPQNTAQHADGAAQMFTASRQGTAAGQQSLRGGHAADPAETRDRRLYQRQQRAVVQASYHHRYGVFIRLDLATGLRIGELLALKWEDIDLAGGQMQIRRTINRLAKYEDAADGNRTEIVLDTPKTRNAKRSIPLTRGMIDETAPLAQRPAGGSGARRSQLPRRRLCRDQRAGQVL